MSYGIIYLITNLVNGKQYVGQTIGTLKSRWWSHCSKRSECTYLRNSIQKHGKENFTIEQIDSAENLDELNDKESYWISKYGTFVNGYNLTSGGRLYEFSKETRIKMGNSRRGAKHSEETKRKIGESNKEWYKHNKNPLTGRKHTEETKIKMSLSASGKNNSQYGLSGGLNANAKKVINLTTHEVFDSLKEASDNYNLKSTGLTNHLKGKTKTFAGHHWMYYDDYLEKQNNKDEQAS